MCTNICHNTAHQQKIMYIDHIRLEEWERCGRLFIVWRVSRKYLRIRTIHSNIPTNRWYQWDEENFFQFHGDSLFTLVLMLFFLVIVSTTIFVYSQATKNCSRFTTCCCSIFHLASFRLTWNCKYSLLSQLHCTYQHNCFKRYFHFLRLSFSTQTAKWTLIEVRAIDIEFIARDNYNNNNINSYNEEKKCAQKIRYMAVFGFTWRCFFMQVTYIYICKVYNERIAMISECVYLLSHVLELKNQRQTILSSKHAKSVTYMCTMCDMNTTWLYLFTFTQFKQMTG